MLISLPNLLGALNDPHHDRPSDSADGLAFVERFGAVVPGRACVTTLAPIISNAGVLTVGSDPRLGQEMLLEVDAQQKRFEAWQVFMKQPTLANAVVLECSFLFMPAAWVPSRALQDVLEPLGQMQFRQAVWTLFRFKEREHTVQ